jgi:hypothetical protein
MSFCKSDQRTAPIETEPSEETVTVVDPSHFLFGRTFPLLGTVTKAYLGRCCVIRLDSTEQFVPLVATDRSPEPLTVYPLPLSVSTIQQLLAVYARIELQLAEGTSNEHHQAATNDSLAIDDDPEA